MFGDIPFTEIITAFDNESKPAKRDTHEAWIWEQLDSAGRGGDVLKSGTKRKMEGSLGP